MSLSSLVSTASGVLANCIGEDVQYIPADGGEPVGFKAAFKTEFEQMDLEAGTPVMVRKPNIMVRHDSMGKPPCLGDRFVVRGSTYKAVLVDEDGANHESMVLLQQEAA